MALLWLCHWNSSCAPAVQVRVVLVEKHHLLPVLRGILSSPLFVPLVLVAAKSCADVIGSCL